MKTILIIDDTEELREMLVLLLEMEGYKALEAESAEAGVIIALEHIPDLVLCDYVLPSKNGSWVFEELQKKPKTQSIPFICLSGMDVEEVSFREKFYFLKKPFTNEQLFKKINSLIIKTEETHGE